MREKKYFLAIKLTIGDIDMAHQWNKRRKVETNRANKDDVDKVAGAGYRDVKATDQQHLFELIVTNYKSGQQLELKIMEAEMVEQSGGPSSLSASSPLTRPKAFTIQRSTISSLLDSSESPRISRNHCTIWWVSPSSFFIQDLDSANGTYICPRGNNLLRGTLEKLGGISQFRPVQTNDSIVLLRESNTKEKAPEIVAEFRERPSSPQELDDGVIMLSPSGLASRVRRVCDPEDVPSTSTEPRLQRSSPPASTTNASIILSAPNVNDNKRAMPRSIGSAVSPIGTTAPSLFAPQLSPDDVGADPCPLKGLVYTILPIKDPTGEGKIELDQLMGAMMRRGARFVSCARVISDPSILVHLVAINCETLRNPGQPNAVPLEQLRHTGARFTSLGFLKKCCKYKKLLPLPRDSSDGYRSEDAGAGASAGTYIAKSDSEMNGLSVEFLPVDSAGLVVLDESSLSRLNSLMTALSTEANRKYHWRLYTTNDSLQSWLRNIKTTSAQKTFAEVLQNTGVLKVRSLSTSLPFNDTATTNNHSNKVPSLPVQLALELRIERLTCHRHVIVVSESTRVCDDASRYQLPSCAAAMLESTILEMVHSVRQSCLSSSPWHLNGTINTEITDKLKFVL